MSLAVGAASASNPIGQLILLVAILAFFGFLIYAFLTRYRGDWDGGLRKLTDQTRGPGRRDEDREDDERGDRDA